MPLFLASIWPVHQLWSRARRMHQRDVERLLGRREGDTALFHAAQDMARADIPESARGFMLATMTALQKRMEVCAASPPGPLFAGWWPKRWPVSSGRWSNPRAHHSSLLCQHGTDCVGHAVRVMTDTNPNKHHNPVDKRHRGIRPRLAQCIDELIAQCSRHARVAAFRQVHLRPSNELQVQVIHAHIHLKYSSVISHGSGAAWLLRGISRRCPRSSDYGRNCRGNQCCSSGANC